MQDIQLWESYMTPTQTERRLIHTELSNNPEGELAKKLQKSVDHMFASLEGIDRYQCSDEERKHRRLVQVMAAANAIGIVEKSYCISLSKTP